MSPLIEHIKKHSHEFSFFQVVSLLEEYYKRKEPHLDPLNKGKIRFSADTSCTFPPNDIAAIKATPKGSIQFFLSFMGLLGISSPLPHYFTEFATKYEKEKTTLSDFLSIFDHRIYLFFFRAWEKYRLISGMSNTQTFGLLKRLAMLSGVKGDHQDSEKKMFAYLGILAQPCRSAEGLKTVVSHFFDNIPVAVQQWQPRWAPVKELKQIGKDSVLGRNAMIGTHIYDVNGKFRISLGPLEKEKFESFLPDKKNTQLLKEIIKEYVTDPLEFDIEVKLKPADLVPVVLGKASAQIGISASCGRSSEKGDPYTIVVN